MTDSISKIIEEIQNWKVPKRLEIFLIRERTPSNSEQTLGFYAFSYSMTFSCLAESVQEKWRGGGFMQLSLFYLARHSIELHLKWAIEEFVNYTRDHQPEDLNHHLLNLWNELKRQCALAEIPDSDDWGLHCKRLIGHIHEIDKTGEAFRYPHNRLGRPFKYTHVEFNGLVEAHQHIASYCGASLDVLGEYSQAY